MSPAHASAGHDRYLIVLGVLFGLLWTALAIHPRYRQDWALKHMPNGDLVDVFALMAPEPELQYKILVDNPARL